MRYFDPRASSLLASLWLSTSSQVVPVSGAVCSARIDARNVSSAADALDLSDALLCSGPGVFEVNWSGKVSLARTIVISNGTSVRVSGYGMGEADGAGVVRLFEVRNGSTLELDGFSLVRGGAESVEVIEGTFIGYGGGLLVSGLSRLAVSSCSFVNNFATSSGGKIDDAHDVLIA